MSCRKFDLPPLIFSQENIPHLLTKNAPPSGRTLILVHAYQSSSGSWLDDWINPSTYLDYYEKIIPIDYYWKSGSAKPVYYIGGEDEMTTETDVHVISDKLYAYITNETNNITDTIDFLSHSMGGLVVRDFICRYYEDLVNVGYIVDDVIMLGTPARGSLLSSFFHGVHPLQYLLFLEWVNIIMRNTDKNYAISSYFMFAYFQTSQAYQIRYDSPFVRSLKVQNDFGNWDETPYGEDDGNLDWPIQINATTSYHNDINWTTIGGDLPLVPFFMLYGFMNADPQVFGLGLLVLTLFLCSGCDWLVATNNVALDGANSYFCLATHGVLLKNPTLEFLVPILTNDA